MKGNIMKYRYFVLGISIVMGIIISCNSQSASSENIKMTNSEKSDQSQIISLDLNSISSMEIQFKENDKIGLIKSEDQKKLVELISSAVYDTNWNDRGIMVKMVPPDYTIQISYKGKPSDTKDWLMIWKESGKVKLNKWYLLPEEKNKEVIKMLDAYQN